MLEFDLVSTNDDKIQLMLSQDRGCEFYVFPQEKTAKDNSYDVFRVGLRTSSVKKLLRAIRYKEPYRTDDRLVVIHGKGDFLQFRHTAYDSPALHFSYNLDRENTDQFIGALNWVVGNIPAEIAMYSKIEDADTLAVVIQALHHEGKALLDDVYWVTLGTTLGTAGYIEEASECFTKALSINPENIESQLNRAVNHNLVGDHEEALQLLTQIPDGKHRRNLFIGQAYSHLERYEEAIPYLEKAVQQEPYFHIPYATLLSILKKIDHPLYGIWVERAFQALPNNPEICWFYCKYLLDEQRLEELAGLDLVDQLEETERTDEIGRGAAQDQYIFESKLYRSAARIYLYGDDFELRSAVNILSAADREMHLCEHAKLLAIAATHLGLVDLISKCYDRVCAMCKAEEIGIPKHLGTLLAEAYTNNQQIAEALAECEKILESDPDHLETLHYYWWNLDELGRDEEAIEVLEKIRSIEPEQDSILYNLGFLAGKNGQIGKAKYYYDCQVQKEPEHFYALENLSFLLLQEGQVEEARSLFNRAMDIKFKRLSVPLEILETTEEEGFNESQVKQAALVEHILNKRNKFAALCEFAQNNANSSTLTYNLHKLNRETEPIIGAEISLGKRKYSIDDALALLNENMNPAALSEVRNILESQKRGDHSRLLLNLERDIPSFDQLPETARQSLLEGEKRLADTSGGDYSMAALSFCKAVEITLKLMIFDVFRKIYLNGLSEGRRGYDGPGSFSRTVEKLMLFLDKGNFLGLGEIGYILKLCGMPEAKGAYPVSELRQFIKNKNVFYLVENLTVEKVILLSQQYRNRAAHSEIMAVEAAVEARKLSCEILAPLCAS